MIRIYCLFLLCTACATPGSSLSVDPDVHPVTIELEGGPLWQSRNDIQISGDAGTQFSMSDLSGEGPYPVGRITADWNINKLHAVRAVIAPIEFGGTGTLKEQTFFADETFAAGVPTEGSYKFNNYRVGYLWTFLHKEHWRLRLGGTLFVRDAKIELEQGAIRASDSNVGVVPLLNFAVEYYPAKRWRIVSELEGLASSQGRALDFTLKGYYDLSDQWSVGLGYRTIEGGADNDEVYNFAWLQSIVAAVAFRF
jgi:hypothetical protein